MLSYMTTELALLAASVVLGIVHIIIVSHLYAAWSGPEAGQPLLP